MKVLMINGSTKKNGTTFRALNEVAKTLEGVGISSEIVSLGANPVRDCAGCNHCQSAEENQCIFGDDAVNDILEKARSADGFVFGSPVYYAQPTGQLLSVLHRLFYAGADAFSFKPCAAVVTLRRAGATARLMLSNKFLPMHVCLWYRPPTGMSSTALQQSFPTQMPRACRPCAISGAIWRGCSAVLRRVENWELRSPRWRPRCLDEL